VHPQDFLLPHGEVGSVVALFTPFDESRKGLNTRVRTVLEPHARPVRPMSTAGLKCDDTRRVQRITQRDNLFIQFFFPSRVIAYSFPISHWPSFHPPPHSPCAG